jgi:hypothetical protein
MNELVSERPLWQKSFGAISPMVITRNMKNTPRHESDMFKRLHDLFSEYLSQRLFDPVPHLTFKRFLVSRNQRSMCDLLDEVRSGKAVVPRHLCDPPTMYTFSAEIENLPGYKGKVIQGVRCY